MLFHFFACFWRLWTWSACDQYFIRQCVQFSAFLSININNILGPWRRVITTWLLLSLIYFSHLNIGVRFIIFLCIIIRTARTIFDKICMHILHFCCLIHSLLTTLILIYVCHWIMWSLKVVSILGVRLLLMLWYLSRGKIFG